MRIAGDARIDLHIHSGESDGRGGLFDLISAMGSRSIRAIAVTDHDTLGTARDAYGYMRHLQEAGGTMPPIVIPGVEVSSKIDTEDGLVDVVHILGLGVDPYNETLTELCERRDGARKVELRRRIEHAASRGFRLSPFAEARVLKGAFWGRAEICREMVLDGRFETVDDAYYAIWDDYPRLGGVEDHEPAEAAIQAIHASRGLAVLAHPLRDEINRGFVTREVAAWRVGVLRMIGLDGIEAWYRTFPLTECEWLSALSEDYGLLTSCGSDHHDFDARFRMGRTCADEDGTNTREHATVLAALGL